jgi:large subunit ribosomal protein L17
MMHAKTGRKLHRTESHRKALFRNMVTSLLEHEKIETTDAKAKELRKVADRMITWGKRGDLHARRLSRSVITSNKVVQKLFSDLAPRFKDREGGYTRIIKVGRRKGDNAPVSIIELTAQREVKAPAKGKKPAKKKTAQPKTPAKSEKK